MIDFGWMNTVGVCDTEDQYAEQLVEDSVETLNR
jgi:hypothetical protein